MSNSFNPGPRLTSQFLTPTWSWASAGAGVWYPEIIEYLSQAQLAAPLPSGDSHPAQQSLLLLTGPLIPGRLKLRRAQDRSFKWVEIEVERKYLEPSATSSSLSSPQHNSSADVEMATADWGGHV
jgi:hypothetical protein